MLNKFFSKKISVCYTLKTDSLSKLGKSEYSPYLDRTDEFIKISNGKYFAYNTKTDLKIEKIKKGYKLNLSTKNKELSQFGINLPFNFLGKYNCEKWRKQFLFNSPYISEKKDFLWVFGNRF